MSLLLCFFYCTCRKTIIVAEAIQSRLRIETEYSADLKDIQTKLEPQSQVPGNTILMSYTVPLKTMVETPAH